MSISSITTSSAWFAAAREARKKRLPVMKNPWLNSKSDQGNPDDLDAKYNYELTLARLGRQAGAAGSRRTQEKREEGQEEGKTQGPGLIIRR